MAAAANGHAPLASAAVPGGTWRERGSRNVAGRVSAVDYDASTDRLTVFAHGGQLWRSVRATLDWAPLDDARHFEPYYQHQNFKRLAGATERLLVADDTQHAFFYSDNQGASWSKSGGAALPDCCETTYLVARDPGGSQVYALIDNYAPADVAKLYVSADRGATFSAIAITATKGKGALLALGQGSGLVYLLSGNVLYRIEANNSLTLVKAIPGTPSQGDYDRIGLAGGITSGGTPTTFFYAFFEAGGVTQVFRSLDEGANWSARGTVAGTANIRVSAATSLHDPNLAFYGAINLFRSIDGGLTFNPVNDWPQYYQNPATNLHADINFVSVVADTLGNDLFFVGTDGGVFQSTDGLATVSNLSLSGLRQSQYYDSYTGRSGPYTLSVGAQDQGYQRNARPPSGIFRTVQVISGDYAHLTSSDGGATIWSTYPTFAQIDPAPSGPPNVMPEWQFSANGSITHINFLPPLVADPVNPKVVWLGGGGSSGASHVFQLTWNSVVQYAGQIAGIEGSFDFGGDVSALAYSPQATSTFFALAYVGGATSFFRTTTPLGGWTKTVATLPQGQFFYGQGLVPDPSRANTIYVCGSGYGSAHPVYVSVDNGTSFNPMDTGLPHTLVYALAISPDGNHLFAATEVGPYYYDRTGATWVDIGAGAADNIYWHVDYVPALRIARFSTFGRGIWDYDLGGGDLISRYDFD